LWQVFSIVAEFFSGQIVIDLELWRRRRKKKWQKKTLLSGFRTDCRRAVWETELFEWESKVICVMEAFTSRDEVIQKVVDREVHSGASRSLWNPGRRNRGEFKTGSIYVESSEIFSILLWHEDMNRSDDFQKRL
jgi:hypothetical protein